MGQCGRVGEGWSVMRRCGAEGRPTQGDGKAYPSAPPMHEKLEVRVRWKDKELW